MKTVLVAINSKFSHTNLAVRSICEYVKNKSSVINQLDNTISFSEYTINQLQSDIIRDIVFSKPDMLLFSVYIWNVSITFEIIRELKKILPDVIIGAGGPEVSYQAELVLEKEENIDFVMSGEGEQTVLELLESYITSKEYFVPGIISRKGKEPQRELFSTLDSLYFAYPDLLTKNDPDPDNRIFYFESSRGCPFRCSYCLSSIDKSVRYMSLEKVFEQLQIFLDANVKLVKFVDRTFNLDEDRTIAIWKYIREHHNNKTMFHFEIAALQLTDKMLQAIKDFPKGIMQFEVGIQSTNSKTLKQINRPADFERIKEVTSRIPKTIHTHLDLIAGLPFENLVSFGKSFDYVLGLRPDMLQLGFLKILSGTEMENYASENNFKKLSFPPYEVLSTPDISYEEIQFLKDVEKILDAYYNSGLYTYTMNYLFSIQNFSIFDFLSDIAKNFRTTGFFDVAHKVNSYYEFLFNYLQTDNKNTNIDFSIISELLRFDFISNEKFSVFPQWYKRNYNKEKHNDALFSKTDVKSTRDSYSRSDYDEFEINPFTLKKEHCNFLFVYNSVKGKVSEKQLFMLNN